MKKYEKLRPIFSVIKEKNYLLLEGSYPSLSQGSQDTNRAIIWNVHCFDCLHCFLWALPPVYWAHTESFSWYLSPRTSTQSLSNRVARLISVKLSVFPRLRDPNFLFIMDKTLIKKTLQCPQWHLNQFALEATAPGAWQGAWRSRILWKCSGTHLPGWMPTPAPNPVALRELQPRGHLCRVHSVSLQRFQLAKSW